MKGREFRRFWLAALGIPTLITLTLSASFVTGAMVDFLDSAWLLACALIPLAWFYGRYLAWRTVTWTFDAEGKALLIRKGVLNQTEKRIPLSFPPQVTCSQSLAGRLLDFGNAELSSFGGPVAFHQVGGFRAFKEALTSPGRVLPEKEPSFLATVSIAFLWGLLKMVKTVAIGLVRLVRTAAPLLAGLLRWLFGQVQAGFSVVAVELARFVHVSAPPLSRFLRRLSGQVRSGFSAVAVELAWLVRASAPLPARLLGWLQKRVRPAVSMAAEDTKSHPSLQRSKVSAFHVNYEGFLAFCDDFLLSNGHRVLPLDYTQPDGERRYYSSGISPEVAQIYFLILRRARIVISGTNGYTGWTLHQQIRKINDISHRIPHEAFDDIANREFVLNRIEQMTFPKMKQEHNLKVTRWNNARYFPKQPLTLSVLRRRKETRPAA